MNTLGEFHVSPEMLVSKPTRQSRSYSSVGLERAAVNRKAVGSIPTRTVLPG
jgi:hypothetical protein